MGGWRGNDKLPNIRSYISSGKRASDAFSHINRSRIKTPLRALVRARAGHWQEDQHIFFLWHHASKDCLHGNYIVCLNISLLTTEQNIWLRKLLAITRLLKNITILRFRRGIRRVTLGCVCLILNFFI